MLGVSSCSVFDHARCFIMLGVSSCSVFEHARCLIMLGVCSCRNQFSVNVYQMFMAMVYANILLSYSVCNRTAGKRRASRWHQLSRFAELVRVFVLQVAPAEAGV